MSRIADVLAELESLGAVGKAAPLAEVAPPPRPNTAAPPKDEAADDVEPEFSGEEAVELLTAGFRDEGDGDTEERPDRESYTDAEGDEDVEEAAPPDPTPKRQPELPSVGERLDVALQEIEAIAEVVEGLKHSLLGIKAELAK